MTEFNNNDQNQDKSGDNNNIYNQEHGYSGTGNGMNMENQGYGNTGSGMNTDNRDYGNTGSGMNTDNRGYGNTGNGVNTDNQSYANTGNGMNNQNYYNAGNGYNNQNYNNGNNGYNNHGYNNNNGMYQQYQYNKVPEYSFWAEQMPGNSYSEPNQGQNSWQYNNADQVNAAKEPVKTKKKGRGPIKFFAKALCFGLIAGISFFGLEKLVSAVDPSISTVQILNTISNAASGKNYEVSYTEAASVTTKDRSVITTVADQVLPSIVSIDCTATQTGSDLFGQQYSQEVKGSGSGIIVAKKDKELLVATNNHVVEGASKISVIFSDGSKAEGVVKGTDSIADLAVVTVDLSDLKDSTLKAIAVAKLGDSKAVKVGQMAIAIGNALGYGQSVTVGYISAKDREVQVSSDGYSSKTMTLLQTDAAINPGNSGGALLNVNGEVIGINTVKYASEEVEGMGYAIPISTATPIINELMNREVLSESEQGYLGIYGGDVTEDAAKFYNIPVGVFIKEVSKGGAAEVAGLKAQDIITKVDDLKITSITQLKDKVNSMRVGTKVKITYMRNSDGEYKEATLTAILQINPDKGTDTNK